MRERRTCLSSYFSEITNGLFRRDPSDCQRAQFLFGCEDHLQILFFLLFPKDPNTLHFLLSCSRSCFYRRLENAQQAAAMPITSLPMFLQHHKEDLMSIMESTDSYAITVGLNVFKQLSEEEQCCHHLSLEDLVRKCSDGEMTEKDDKTNSYGILEIS
ncbi:uncharacterized protein [Aristolochia californica]|uniref:uncharacterized protein isoform X2 n=1 Tax=Aristolochia californica TaxID=171875 RepID=UPI0035DA56EE